MSNKCSQISLVLLGIFIAIGLAAGGYFIGQTMYNARVAINTADAKGLAERRVKADRANWSLSFDVTESAGADIPKLYKQAERTQERIMKMLLENGLSEDEVDTDVIDYSHNVYRNKHEVIVDETHTMRGSISVETNKVDLIAKIRKNTNKLIIEGINISNHAPSYYFTKLNEIKPDMLKEATKNARIAASEFAKNAGANVGRIRSAYQGTFSVRDAGADYGDTAKIEKDVRVVTTITFYLTE